jgi:hypothetical protein
VRPHRLYRSPCSFHRALRVVAGVEVGGGQVLGAVEGELAVAAELLGDRGQLFDLVVEAGR